MRVLWWSALGLALTQPALAQGPAPISIRLDGQVKDLPGAVGVYLIDPQAPKDSAPVLSTRTDAEGRFVLQGAVPEAAVYLLKLDSVQSVAEVPLAAGDALHLTGSRETMDKKRRMTRLKYTLEGSADVALVQEYNQLLNTYGREYIKRITAQGAVRDDAFAAAGRRLVRQHPASQVSAYWLKQRLARYADQAVFVDSMTSVFRQTLPASRYTRQLAEGRTAAVQLVPGRPLPALPATVTPTGEAFDLAKYRGQYVLLDFWASWCKPCREENPDMLARYQRLHGKGLEIVGLSLDDNKDKWVKAVAADQLPWPQSSDLKGWQGPVATTYDVHAIPTSILLDPQGNVLAVGLRGKELDKKLKEVLPK